MATVYFATNRDQRKAKTKPFGDQFHQDGPGFYRVGGAEISRKDDDDPRSYEIDWDTVVVEDEAPADPAAEAGEILGSTQIFDSLQQHMQNNQRDILVFLHGFANNFEDSLRGAAQIADSYVIEPRDGSAPYNPYAFVFSWPSNGKVQPAWNYKRDREDAAASGTAMARALMRLLDFLKIDDEGRRLRNLHLEEGEDDFCNQRLHLVAHSMGNWALRHAVLGLKELMKGGRLPPIFENIFLMAADEDDDALEDPNKLGVLPQLTRNIHVYHSSDDRALFISDTTKMNPDRLGTHGPKTFSGISARINAVDCSKVDDTGKLSDGNHQYFRFRKEVIYDVRRVLAGRLHPDEIPNREIIEPGRRYRIKAE